MEVVHVTKGSLWATLRATGKAAHSSMPERGENAILKLTRALDRIDTHLVPELATFTHPVLGRSTLNVGMIRGAARANIVPDFAEAEVDIRITPSLSAAGGALALLKDTITSHELPLAIIGPHENPPMETAAEHPMIQSLLDQGSKLAGAPPGFSMPPTSRPPECPPSASGRDSIDQAHIIDEFIDIEALERGADFSPASSADWRDKTVPALTGITAVPSRSSPCKRERDRNGSHTHQPAHALRQAAGDPLERFESHDEVAPP